MIHLKANFIRYSYDALYRAQSYASRSWSLWYPSILSRLPSPRALLIPYHRALSRNVDFSFDLAPFEALNENVS
jgi:hypothetical protein